MKHLYYITVTYEGVKEKDFYGAKEDAEEQLSRMLESLAEMGANVLTTSIEIGEDD